MIESESFICDFMLGRLAKWLRLLGFDTEYYNNPDGQGILHRALKEGRTIVTRHKEFKKYDNVIIIESENLDDQLSQIRNIFKFPRPFSRCPVCNKELQSVSKEKIKEKVPEYIYNIHSDFKICPECERIFWKGTHYKEIINKINEIIS